jgi:hypothetical protein
MTVRSPYDDIATCPCPLCVHHSQLLSEAARSHLLRALREYKRLGVSERKVADIVGQTLAEVYP